MNYARQPLPPRLSKEFSVLIVANINDDTAVSRSASEICNELAIDGIRVVTSKSLTDFETAVSSSPAYSCVVLGWGICQADHQKALQAIKILQKRCAGIPIILGVTKQTANHIPLEFSEVIESVIYIPEDSPKFIAGRIKAASKRYLDSYCLHFLVRWSTLTILTNIHGTHQAILVGRLS